MLEQFAALTQWPYLIWAAAAATTFYGTTVWAVSHLHPDKKALLSLWLQGDYNSTWTTQFCAMFDQVFTKDHLGFRCMLRSALASVLAVCALWWLFDGVLEMIDVRTETELSLAKALLLGIAINIIPDYLSLFQTRWLLNQFRRISNPILQLLLLLLDAVVTGTIIYVWIALYNGITAQPAVSVIEMTVVFSGYAVFFYSTFLTSVWAWIYCASYWVARVSSGMRRWLDMQNQPGRSLGVIGAIIVFIASVAIKPALTIDQGNQISVDDWLCEMFPRQICKHLIRLSENRSEQQFYLGQQCFTSTADNCLENGIEQYRFEPHEALSLWQDACGRGLAYGCTHLGLYYDRTGDVLSGFHDAKDAFLENCAGHPVYSCLSLENHFDKHHAGLRNVQKATTYFLQACDGGDAVGCLKLGDLSERRYPLPESAERIEALYQKACDGQVAEGCGNLGRMLLNRSTNTVVTIEAMRIILDACERGAASACTSAGMFNADMDRTDAGRLRKLDLFSRGCIAGDVLGCLNKNQIGVDDSKIVDLATAHVVFDRMCRDSISRGCLYLAAVYKLGAAAPDSDQYAAEVYQQACEMNDPWSCNRLTGLPDQTD